MKFYRTFIKSVSLIVLWSWNTNAQYNNTSGANDVNTPGTSEDEFTNYSNNGMSFGNEEEVPNNAPANNTYNNTGNVQNINQTATNVVQPTDAVSVPKINTEAVVQSNDFIGAPMVPGSLRTMADGEAPEEYITEEGDTLFDICSQLLDEGGYWPKLWALNPQIKNPHFIWPGMKLVFYPGDKDVPPFMEVATENDLVPIDKGGIVETQLMTGNVPDFLQTYAQQGVEFIDQDDASLMEHMNQIVTVSGERFNPTERRYILPGFIVGEEKAQKAIVVSGLEGEILLGDAMEFVVEVVEGVSVGATYTILRPNGEIKNSQTGDDVGYYYSTVANVRVKEMIQEGKYAIVQMDQNILNAEVGDVLVDYVSTNRVISLVESVGSISTSDAQVVAFQNAGQNIGAETGMVFLDKGSNGGISNGQFYQVFTPAAKTGNSQSKEALDGVKIPVATIKIIDTTDVSAVGYIVNNKKEVSVGDSLGKG